MNLNRNNCPLVLMKQAEANNYNQIMCRTRSCCSGTYDKPTCLEEWASFVRRAGALEQFEFTSLEYCLYIFILFFVAFFSIHDVFLCATNYVIHFSRSKSQGSKERCTLGARAQPSWKILILSPVSRSKV
jgi:hypothetical protein